MQTSHSMNLISSSLLAAGLLTGSALLNALAAVETDIERSRDGDTVTVVKTHENDKGGTGTVTREVTRSEGEDGGRIVHIDREGNRTNAEGEQRSWDSERTVERVRNEDGSRTVTVDGHRENSAGRSRDLSRESTITKIEQGVREFEHEKTITKDNGKTVTVESSGTATRNEDGSWDRSGSRTVTGEKGTRTTDIDDTVSRKDRASRQEKRHEQRANQKDKRQAQQAKKAQAKSKAGAKAKTKAASKRAKR